MGSSDTDLKALDSVITVAGALAAIFGGIAGVAGWPIFSEPAAVLRFSADISEARTVRF
ncbi:hypothetical protein ACETU7_19890 [Rhodococcus sp. 3Y1]